MTKHFATSLCIGVYVTNKICFQISLVHQLTLIPFISFSYLFSPSRTAVAHSARWLSRPCSDMMWMFQSRLWGLHLSSRHERTNRNNKSLFASKILYFSIPILEEDIHVSVFELLFQAVIVLSQTWPLLTAIIAAVHWRCKVHLPKAH